MLELIIIGFVDFRLYQEYYIWHHLCFPGQTVAFL